MRALNPSPYLFWLHFPKLDLVGSSPEALVTLEGDRAILRPIAGTKGRGQDLKEDKRLACELLGDAKERSEHEMLLELGKKDLAKVAKEPLVVERELCLERYSHVMHLVSQLSAKLMPQKDAFDLFEACFPAGTVSGVPKESALKLIQSLEPHSRGPYGGAVGYFSFAGNMDFCIAIRMLVFEKGKAWVQAGAGVVAESDPGAEYEETILKAQALIEAVATAGGEGDA